MAKLTLAELKKLREAKSAEMNPRDTAHKDVQIIVGMGTCGIAAEAKKTFDVLVDELDKAGMPNVAIRQTGCMGLCHSEPTVEVVVPGMPTVVYGNVDAETARKIVKRHIIAVFGCGGHIFDKPAADIVRK